MRPLLPVFLVLSLSLSAAEIPLSYPIISSGSPDFKRDNPIVVAGNGGYLVAWTEEVGGWWPGGLKIRTYDANGMPRQETAILIDSTGMKPHAVWTGSEYLLVFTHFLYRPTAEMPAIFTVRVTPEGLVHRDTTIATTRSGANIHAIAWDGEHALVAVSTSHGTRLLTLDANGNVVAEEPLAEAPAAMAGTFRLAAAEGDAVAEHDGTFAVLDNTSGGVSVAFMDAEHRVQSTFVLAPDGREARTIEWDGDAWTTAWIENDSVCRARFTSASDVAKTCNTDASPAHPAIARGFAAWSRGGNRIVTDGGLASEELVTQTQTAATLDANGLVAAWIENDRVHVGGFTHDGSRRDVRVIIGNDKAREPRLSHWLLVWQDGPTIAATRTDATLPIVQLGTGYAHAMASNGRDALVAWIDNAQIAVTLVTSNLDTTGVQRFGTPSTHVYFYPSVAATADGFLLAWAETQLGEPLTRRIVVQRFSASGLPVASPITIFETTNDDFLGTAIGCGPSTCLVTWRAAEGTMLHGALVAHDGTPRGAPRILARERGARDVVMPRDDGSFLVAAGPLLVSVASNVTVQRWTNDTITLGGAAFLNAQPALVYEREGRAYLRTLSFARTRGVRH